MCFKLPETANKDDDMEAACTLGVGWISAAQALKQRLYKDEKVSNGIDDTVSLINNYTKYNIRPIDIDSVVASHILRCH